MTLHSQVMSHNKPMHFTAMAVQLTGTVFIDQFVSNSSLHHAGFHFLCSVTRSTAIWNGHLLFNERYIMMRGMVYFHHMWAL